MNWKMGDVDELLVRFPDGTVRHGYYSVTHDAVWPRLFDTQTAAWHALQRAEYSRAAWESAFLVDPEGLEEDVVVCVKPGPSGPGEGRHWPARATRNAVTTRRAQHERITPDGDIERDWAPDWADPEWSKEQP